MFLVICETQCNFKRKRSEAKVLLLLEIIFINIILLFQIYPGFVMNLLGVGVITLMINTLGIPLFNINEFPSWANSTVADTYR